MKRWYFTFYFTGSTAPCPTDLHDAATVLNSDDLAGRKDRSFPGSIEPVST